MAYLRRCETLLGIEQRSSCWGLATFFDKKLKFRVAGDDVMFYTFRSGGSDGKENLAYRSPKRGQQVLEAWKKLHRKSTQ